MGKVQLNVWVEEAQRDAVKAKAAAAGVPVGRLVVEAVLGSSVEKPLEDRFNGLSSRMTELSDYVDRSLGGLENLERRLSRLEEMAGL